jgi:RHS repeat-associated protein
MNVFIIAPTIRSWITRCLLAVSIVALLGVAANAQSTTDASTPAGMAPGAPAGSYQLSGFDNINFFNGNLNFNLPLLKIGGRGEVQDTIALKLEQKWHVFASRPANIYYPEPVGWQGFETGYGPGVLIGRLSGMPTPETCGGDQEDFSLLRLTFTTSDGTEYELHDKFLNGYPGTTHFSNCSLIDTTFRGKEFVSADGSSTTFISDDDLFDAYSDMRQQLYPSGYLLLKNGTRYRIEMGLVMWIRDRNGNKMTFEYSGSQVSKITDSLNRSVTITNGWSQTRPYSDTITYKGFGGATRTIRVWHDMLSTALRSGYTLQYVHDLFPLNGASTSTLWDREVVTAVDLPNGKSYHFKYNPYGELARVELPTGGAFEYDHDGGFTDNNPGLYLPGPFSHGYEIYRRVVERRVYADGANLTSKMKISKPEAGGTTNVGYAAVENFDAAGARLTSEKHYYYGSAKVPHNHQPTDYSAWKDGKEWKTEIFAADGTTLLRRSEQTWQQPVLGYGWPLTLAETNDATRANNPLITQSVTTLSDTNQVSKQTFAFDQYHNRTHVYEYDFGSGAAGSLVRRTHTDYLTGTSYTSAAAGAYLLGLPAQQSVFDAGGTERARTTYEYDNYASDTNHAGLYNRPSISGFDSSFTTSYTTRGNPTGTTNYFLNTSGSVTGSVASYAQYDIAGNLIKTIDARGYATTLYHDDYFGTPGGNLHVNSQPSELSTPGKVSYGFVTSATNAMNHTVYTQFDYYSGKPVNSEDANGTVSSFNYNEALDRPTQVVRGVGTGVVSQSSFSYDDTTRTVTTTSDLTSYGDNALVSKVLYDGLGRTIESRQYEDATRYIATQQQYDALGQAFKSSNPFRPVSPDNKTPIWTTTGFDALGRVVSVTTPDSATVSTSYSGNQVTVTDQAGKKRKSVTDGLGRLKEVYEDPTSLNYLTSYSYDVLDNLTTVSQDSQTRTFAYDSLKRLTSAANPESGTISCQYDSNGNLTSKVDARSITTTLTYDALNRLTAKSYNDSPLTPRVDYYYDSAGMPSGAPTFTRGSAVGRLVAVTYGGGSAGTYRGYDVLGQVVRQHQQTDSVNYLVEATYNLAGGMASETYPSVPGAGDRRTVTYTPDGAGRMASLSSSATSYAPGASVSSIGYAAHNALKTETYGNSLVHGITYNNRLQPYEIKLGSSGSPASVVGLTYSYGTTNNNGNVQSIAYAGGGLSNTQSFGYDALNRLTTSSESGSSWSQTNGYDRYGNRWIDLGGGSQSLTFNTSNRITNSGYSYDGAGNLTNDSTQSFNYDAENKISKFNSASAYTYDGEGQRVRKLVQENLRFVYGIGGQLIAEFSGANGTLAKEYIYGASGLVATIEPPAVNSNGTRYTTSDHLGTPRVVTNSSAGVVSRHDYKPFGDEIPAGIGGRTTGMGFSVPDGVRQKFTSKERDNETGLDYFLARYYSSTQGRFTSPDEFTGGPEELFDFAEAASANPTFYADLGNPQSLNKYQYTYNNPLRYTDPDGHCPAGTPCPVLEMIAPDAGIGAGKAIANIGLGMNNFMAERGLGEHVEPYKADNFAQDIGMIITEKVSILGAFLGGRPQVGGVLVADTKTTAQVAAISAADEVRLLPGASRPGAAGALVATNGQSVTATTKTAGVSAGVQGALDRVPPAQRSAFHGKCCEPRLISKAQNAGINVRGADISVVRVRGIGNAAHGTTLPACSSCRAVLDFYGIK